MRKGFVLFCVVVVALVVIWFTTTTSVPTGHTGIVTTFGNVEDFTFEAGFRFKSPFQSIVLIDNRTQKATLTLSAFSSDIQQVDVICTVNYEVNKATAQDLYKNIGTDYYDKVMSPRIQEDVKAVFTKYTAENLIGARATLADQVKDLLLPYMNEKGIKIVSVAIENIDFTDAFTNAVEEKQVALQTKLRVETEQAQQVSVEKASAERKVISANADASVQKINADAAAYTKTVQATAEAEANKKIASSLTEPLIEYWKINKWNGTVPQFQSGGTGTSIFPVIDMTNQG